MDTSPPRPARSFDPESLRALYAGSSADIEELASKFVETQALVAKAFADLQRRIEILRGVCKPLEAFGIDLSQEPATREAAKKLSEEGGIISTMSLSSLCQCVLTLDNLLHKTGRGPDERARISQEAFEICVGALPDDFRGQIEPHWRQHWERVAVAMSSGLWDPADRKPKVRL